MMYSGMGEAIEKPKTTWGCVVEAAKLLFYAGCCACVTYAFIAISV